MEQVGTSAEIYDHPCSVCDEHIGRERVAQQFVSGGIGLVLPRKFSCVTSGWWWNGEAALPVLQSQPRLIHHGFGKFRRN